MKPKISFIGLCLIGVLGGCTLTALALFFSGAGHSPFIETLISLMKFGAVVAAISSIALVIAIIIRLIEKTNR